MSTNQTIVLTPAQFQAARALAKTYSHLWATVPNGTYALDAIHNYAAPLATEFGGITLPSYRIDEITGNIVVHHTTVTGRLYWEVSAIGSVELRVYRPNLATRYWEQAWRLSMPEMSEDLRQREGIAGDLVAWVSIENNDQEIFDISDETASIIVHTERHGQEHEFATIPGYRSRFALQRDYDQDDLLSHTHIAERHVAALIRPIVALLEASTGHLADAVPPERPAEHANDADWTVFRAAQETYREAYHTEILQPAIHAAKTVLASLFRIALPDPFIDKGNERPIRGTEELVLPQTYWSRPNSTVIDDRTPISVHHTNERMLVESENTAVYMVLLLRAKPETPILTAYHEAVQHARQNPRPSL